MKTYKIQFSAVTLGAIGKKQKFTETVSANNLYEANLKLYDKYDHITLLSVNGKRFDYNLTEKEWERQYLNA
jgi:hypothetical protein